jgi:uncharacterized protein (TIGR00266 family)
MPRYSILGADLQAVVCDMDAGERVIAETGHLLAMTDGLSLDTNTGGGFMTGIKRALGGSSFFVNEVVASSAGKAIFASPSPGHIQELDVSPQKGWLCQPNVFLCSDPGIKIEAAVTQSFGAGLFGGTGFILQSLSGVGKSFIHVGGACIKFDLAAGQSIRIETGSLAAFESTVTYQIEMVKGLRSILFSGEGLWFAHLQGPGAVYIQSLALPKLAHSLIPYLPRAGEGGGSDLASGAIGGILGAIMSGRD